MRCCHVQPVELFFHFFRLCRGIRLFRLYGGAGIAAFFLFGSTAGLAWHAYPRYPAAAPPRQTVYPPGFQTAGRARACRETAGSGRSSGRWGHRDSQNRWKYGRVFFRCPYSPPSTACRLPSCARRKSCPFSTAYGRFPLPWGWEPATGEGFSNSHEQETSLMIAIVKQYTIARKKENVFL